MSDKTIVLPDGSPAPGQNPSRPIKVQVRPDGGMARVSAKHVDLMGTAEDFVFWAHLLLGLSLQMIDLRMAAAAGAGPFRVEDVPAPEASAPGGAGDSDPGIASP